MKFFESSAEINTKKKKQEVKRINTEFHNNIIYFISVSVVTYMEIQDN